MDTLGGWLWWGILVLVGLSIIAAQFLGSSFWSLLFLPVLAGLVFGVGFGVFMGLMSSNQMADWKGAYRMMRTLIRCLAMILVGFFLFAIGAALFGIIVNPRGAERV